MKYVYLYAYVYARARVCVCVRARARNVGVRVCQGKSLEINHLNNFLIFSEI